MNKYQNLLLALGITVSSSHLVEAREDNINEDLLEISTLSNKNLSPIFVDLDIKDMEDSLDSGNGICSNGTCN
jgi:hypothetical protein